MRRREAGRIGEAPENRRVLRWRAPGNSGLSPVRRPRCRLATGTRAAAGLRPEAALAHPFEPEAFLPLFTDRWSARF